MGAEDGDDEEEEEEEEEDLVDPATVIKEKCAETDCTKYKERLDECNNRVQSKNKTTPALRKSLTSTTASTIAQQKRFLSMSSRVDSVIGLSQELGAIIFGEMCSPVFHLQPV